MTNALVASPVDTSTPFQGAFLLEDGEALVNAIQSGNWVDGGLAAFSAIGDTIAAVMDPLGSLIAAGLGWVMEHLEPLKGWLNDLTGDAGEVAAFAQTWTNISTQLAASGDELVRILSDLEDSDGEAVQAYLRFQADAAEHIRAAGSWAEAMSVGMATASMMVQLVHDLTRDAIAQVVGSVISYATTLVVTLGTATPYVIAQATSRVSALATRVGTTITKLLRSSDELMRLIDKLGALFKRLDDLASKVLPGGGHGSSGPRGTHPDDGTTYNLSGGHPHAALVDSTGRDLSGIRAQSTLTDAELHDYLRAEAGNDAADAYTAIGTWPANVQIPKDPTVIGPDGKIDWTQVPKNGYVLDGSGSPIKHPIEPQPGDVIDRYGPSSGRFTSPVLDDRGFDYDQRSLPYVEDMGHYHQYEVTRPFSELRAAYDECADSALKAKIDSNKHFDWNTSTVQSGDIAKGFGRTGGGLQWEMPLNVDTLVRLGMLKVVV